MSAQADKVKAAVSDVINRIYSDSGRPKKELNDDDTLTGNLGLDSLDLAVLVVGLEQALQVDPFRSGAAPVATVGKLVDLYADALQNETSGGSDA